MNNTQAGVLALVAVLIVLALTHKNSEPTTRDDSYTGPSSQARQECREAAQRNGINGFYYACIMAQSALDREARP